MRILSVDDRADNCYLIEAILKGNGYEVQSVANGAEALLHLEKENFDLIISDILMPVMDGFELCRKVKTDESLRAIPFIVYTATYTGPQDEAFALKIGADRFIVKPCEPDVLLAAVDELLAAGKNGRLETLAEQPQEDEVFKLYNERLVRKLEQKMMQLERETKALQEVQDALQTSEKKYRRLHESMIDGFVYTDMQGKILDSNESYRNMLGYSADELAGLTYIDLTPSQWHTFEQNIVSQQIFRNDYSDVYEKEYIKKDGSIFPVELRTFLVRNDRGEAEGMWAIVRDLTERRRSEKVQKELEGQLHQAQKMESVGRLAGGVAHDYNNMLSVILGYTEMALHKTEPDSPLHGDLREILDAAKRSANITRQLLAFARKQTIAPQVLDLNETVEGMLKMLRRLIGEDIDLVWHPAPNLWPILIDPSQIDQVLANLCVNARDAITGVGRLIIETGKEIFDTDSSSFHARILPGEYVMVAVSDNGCGMSKELLDMIFEPFFTTKDLGCGTGLGLSTVYGIVKQNGGFINVYSELSQGTTFKIYLPRHAAAAEIIKEDKKVIRPGRGEGILVVEDEAAILRLTSRILQAAGYRVVTASHPSQAIIEARKNIDLLQVLITDVIMPEMNGRELAALLLTEIPGMKCLFMSGYTANVITGQGALDNGMNFLQKPFTAEGLVLKVQEALA
jgi:two-component system, cell cycle sensor histidine kinase and response regulator CckA